MRGTELVHAWCRSLAELACRAEVGEVDVDTSDARPRVVRLRHVLNQHEIMAHYQNSKEPEMQDRPHTGFAVFMEDHGATGQAN